MDLLTPSIGNIFWTAVVFLLLVVLLKAFAWKPILSAVKEREDNIQDALNQAKLAKKEMETLKADNERIMREAKIERDAMLKEAREIKDRIVAEAKDAAKSEGDKLIEAARQTINEEKNAAMADIKSQIGILSVNIAESILKQKLENSEAQNELVQNYLNKSNLN
ncbi:MULTISPECIES: F0F1 ATP synthase subunit B [Chryseobacterium]|jgi:F-type H+-transporting ATPase subunit b|uniref:ATP synthase subunit b n=4 Tax=Chryseobacterium TaxID=59732 RepID=A0A9Q3USH6_9FLAO|nr:MULTISPECIES: F0F1 ATP synthase subunit B [Chryseobacterium]AZB28965.1 F0F1 ATP synthase subunit B [Chryseobacterium balustinum]MBD3903968.1 F0F1 ATP synthase subunit B [Chryseobacterium muglaense]MBM7419776.1 F-type H+-transporting ATPase subunit b [Chryseobacterium sp. JUb44]MBO6184405.1 F0F1 ATP synthase subunit B [Chryseobacterium sp.]MBW3523606.1 F0F1 ATP synthase subunit B [Chryseobacterium sp. NKUCC03_KSP]